MISIIIPICNTEQYIAQYIRMTGWRIKKILTTIYETAEKTGVDYVEMGMQRVMDRYLAGSDSRPLTNIPHCCLP